MNIHFTWVAPEGTHLTVDDFPINEQVTVIIGDMGIYGELKDVEIVADRRHANVRVMIPDMFIPAALQLPNGPQGFSLSGAGRFSSTETD